MPVKPCVYDIYVFQRTYKFRKRRKVLRDAIGACEAFKNFALNLILRENRPYARGRYGRRSNGWRFKCYV
jgi:hypothetical protein